MDDAGTFFDAFARTYDARVGEQTDADAPLAGDVRFYRDLAAGADGPALEVGVGTGRVYLELVAEGLDVDGIDLSRGMLRRLREKAADRDLPADVWLADVAEPGVEREYGLIYAPARAINHLTTLEDQLAALRSVRWNLAPGGRFACNTFVPSFEVVVEEYGEPREDYVTVDGTTYRVETETTLADPIEQTIRYRRALYLDGERLAERETPLALIPKRQFELLFDLAGFEGWSVQGGFDGGALKSTSQEMVWIART